MKTNRQQSPLLSLLNIGGHKTVNDKKEIIILVSGVEDSVHDILQEDNH